MAIKVGDKMPAGTFKTMTKDGPQDLTTDQLFKRKKVVLFSVPGAFTPTCSAKHLPGFVEKAAELRAKGVGKIVCLAVNDVFVMSAWKRDTDPDNKIEFLADGNGEFAKGLDMTFDGSGNGLGTRSKRYAMVVDDGVVKTLNVEDAPGKADISGAENLLKGL